jgi:TonB-dependent receptor
VNTNQPRAAGRASLLGFCIASVLAQAQAQETAAGGGGLEEVVVTGFRQSLTNATEAKRDSTSFTDSVFAEDIGKFPDMNIAESLNRIPGIQLTREVTGEGLNVAIRGLGTNFTKVVLNGTQIGVASSGRTDSNNQNRELDLDLFPTELFTRLDVNKTPVASMVEGGVAGTVNMRSARPFDNPGSQLTYQVQQGYSEIGGDYSPRGAITGSWTNDTFGVLVGIAGVSNKATTEGFETIGWTNLNVNYTLCGHTPPVTNPVTLPTATDPACNATGGNGWTMPATVPNNAGAGLVAGQTIDRAFVERNNPGLTLEQISNALIPRLGRPAYISGSRDRVSGLVSFEYRPSDDLSFYLDTLYAEAKRDFDRLDVNWVGRNGAAIPLNLQVDDNNVVTSGTFANAQFFLEARPYSEEVDFYNINPGVHWDTSDTVAMDFQVNKSRSEFFREAPTILVNTPLNQNIVVTYTNDGGDIPNIATNVDLNDPSLGWTWTGGRVNIQNERRITETGGAHFDVRFGDDQQNIRVGAAYDEISRDIIAYDNSRQWQQVVCGGGGTYIPPPAAAPGCNGQAGSAITQAALASYLRPGPGFISVDFDRFFRDTNYHALAGSAPITQSSATAAATGSVDEDTWGAYVELNGQSELLGRTLRYNVGTRFISTYQVITGPVMVSGGLQNQSFDASYDEFLPSFNSAWNLTDDVVLRLSASRTLTRANPSAMLPNTTFSDISAQNANRGNPEIAPFLSTNFDLGGEWYTGAEGYVGLTLFNKQLTGFTVLGTTTIPFSQLGIPFSDLNPDQQRAINNRGGPNAATVTVQQQVNAGGVLTIRGYEVNWVQPLTVALEGLGFQANYTRVTQKGSGAGAPAQAIGISPTTYSGTVYWENFGASIRLSYTWNDEQISSGLNQQGIPLAQLYTDARGQLDMSASYEFTSLPTSPQVTLNWINITSETQRQTFQFDNATHAFYDPGYAVLLGLRGKF